MIIIVIITKYDRVNKSFRDDIFSSTDDGQKVNILNGTAIVLFSFFFYSASSVHDVFILPGGHCCPVYRRDDNFITT